MFDTTIPFYQSLRGRLLAALALVALISVIGLGLAAYFNERAALEAQVTAQLTSVADLKKEQIISWLNERQADVRLLAVNKLTQEHFTEILSPNTPAQRKAEFAAFLADNLIGLQQSRDGYSQIVMVDTKGTVVIATDPALVGQSVAGSPTFAATLTAPDRVFIQDIHFDPASERFEMEFGRVMYAVDPATLAELPQVIGVVIITVNMDETIYPLIRAWPGMGSTGETLLVRVEDDSTLFLNNLRFDEEAALKLRLPTGSANARPAHLAAQGAEGIIQTLDYRGTPVLAAYRHIPGIGWGFVAKEDLDEAFAPVNALALHELSLAVSSSLEPAQVLRMAVDRIVQLLDAAAVGLFLTTETGALRPGALKSPEWPVSDSDHLATANLLWPRLRASGESSQFVDLTELVECEAYPPACDLQQAGVRRVHLTPLTHGGQVLGMVSMLWFRADVTAAEVQLAQTVAQIISPAIAHAQSFYQTYEQLRQTNQRLAPLNQISSRLSAILDLEPLLAKVAQLMHGQLGYDRVRVGLIEGEEVVFRLESKAEPSLPSELRFQLGQQSIDDWAAIYGQALLGLSGGQHGRQETSIRSELAVPIYLAGRTLGVLLVGSHTRPVFAEADQALLQAIAGQLALALENARSYGQVRQQARALTQVNAELAQVAQTKTDFINWLSHEMRSPLTAIVGYAEMLQLEQTGGLNKTQLHYTQTIWHSGQHLVRLVNDALVLAKIEAGKMELLPATIQVTELFNYVVSMLAKQAADKDLELKLDLAEPALQLRADLTRLRQILINLLSNAIKFTPPGGVVTVRAAAQAEEEILLSVADTGVGLKPEDFPKIFGQFEQLDNGLTRSEIGTGLGLAVTKRLVELHQGRIWFESTYGSGTTFFVALPISLPLAQAGPTPGMG